MTTDLSANSQPGLSLSQFLDTLTPEQRAAVRACGERLIDEDRAFLVRLAELRALSRADRRKVAGEWEAGRHGDQ